LPFAEVPGQTVALLFAVGERSRRHHFAVDERIRAVHYVSIRNDYAMFNNGSRLQPRATSGLLPRGSPTRGAVGGAGVKPRRSGTIGLAGAVAVWNHPSTAVDSLDGGSHR